jgi:hypothetical protein
MTVEKILKRVGPAVKRLSPGLYDKTVKILFSETARSLSTIHKLPGQTRIIAANHPRFAVNICARMGLGAHMSWTAGVLAYCDEHQLSPRLIFTNPLYAAEPGADWLDEFFERMDALCDAPSELPLPVDRYIPQGVNLLRKLRRTYANLTIERTHDHFFRYLNFRKELREEADLFCLSRGIGLDTVGVHFRGTDKRLEATRVDWNQIADATRAALDRGKSSVFVATDEPDFLEFMVVRFGSERVVDLGCQEIFQGSPAHLTKGDPVIKGKEAIKTMLVLSRCGLLVRTRSHFSAWAKIINPSIPTVVFGEMLASDLLRFPEHLIQTEGSLS